MKRAITALMMFVLGTCLFATGIRPYKNSDPTNIRYIDADSAVATMGARVSEGIYAKNDGYVLYATEGMKEFSATVSVSDSYTSEEKSEVTFYVDGKKVSSVQVCYDTLPRTINISLTGRQLKIMFDRKGNDGGIILSSVSFR